MGNIIVGQSGGPTAVINSSLAGIIKAASLSPDIDKIYGMHYGIEGFLKEDIIDLGAYFHDIPDFSMLKRTPSAFLGSCRYKLPDIGGNEDLYKKIFGILNDHDISYFLYIGGNDSMDTIKKLSDYATMYSLPQKFIGIPKTIDNDLPFTDHTPGFGSAAKFIGTTMKEIICDNESFGATAPKVCVVEIMGRNAGWLTGAAALSKSSDNDGPDLIYLPEVPFDMDDFIAKVEALSKKKGSIVIAVSEGLTLADGRMVCELSDAVAFVDAFGHRQLTGCARVLTNEIARRLGLNTRCIELSVLQRCATHLASRADIDEAYNVGYIGVQTAVSGETGKMITIHVESREPYVVTYGTVDVHKVANLERKVPVEWITRDNTYVSDDFIEYVSPLIIGSLTPYYAAGLPKHLRLKKEDRASDKINS